MAKKFRDLIKGMSPERILKIEAEVKSILLEMEKYSNESELKESEQLFDSEYNSTEKTDLNELVPNSITLEAMAELEAGKGKSSANISELMADLLSEDNAEINAEIDTKIDRPLELCMFCDHANENPQYCYCDDNCYCKNHTCIII